MKPLTSFLSQWNTLQLTLGVSVALHAAVLSVRFVDPAGFDRMFQDTPLEVILVNAQSTEKPDKAQAIAQFSLAGGGDADKGRATSPLPYSALTTVGDDFEEAQRKMDALQEQQTLLLAQLRKDIAALPAPDPRKPAQNAQEAAEQKRRHQGGTKWIGTGGTSPFGAEGYNPEGVRIGQRDAPRVGDYAGILQRVHRQFGNIGSPHAALPQPAADAHADAQAGKRIDDAPRAFLIRHPARIDAYFGGDPAVALRRCREVETDDVFQQQRVALAVRQIEEAAHRMR